MDYQNFQDLCLHVLKEKYKDRTISQLEGSGGDEGVDVLEADLADGRCIWQCKNFTDRIRSPQKKQIKHSLKTAVSKHRPAEWVLCIPIDLDISARKWFEALKKKYSRKVRIGLLGASDLAHELIYRRSIRELFFPGLVVDVTEVNSLVRGTNKLSTKDLRKLSANDVEEYIRRLEEQDPRFTYRVTFPEQRSFPPPREIIPPSGAVLSVLDEHGRIDVIPRDLKAIQQDPPRLTFTLKSSAIDKLRRSLASDTQAEFGSDEIIDLKSTFDFLRPVGSRTSRLTIRSSGNRKRNLHLRVTFASTADRIVYPLVEFAHTRSGTEEAELSTVDKDLPFNLKLTTRRDRSGNFLLEKDFVGKDVRQIQRALRAIAILFSGGSIELYDVRKERRLGRATTHPQIAPPEFNDLTELIGRLAFVSEAFGLDLVLRNDSWDSDMVILSKLLEVAKTGALVAQDVRFSVTLTKNAAGDQLEPLRTDASARIVLTKLEPVPVLMGIPVDTGPCLVHMKQATVANREETMSHYSKAEKGASLRFDVVALGPAEIVFYKFATNRFEELLNALN